MPRLAFYRDEKLKFPDAFNKPLSCQEIGIIFKKLCRHFKINPRLQFGRGSNANGCRVQLSNKWGKNLGILCHELAHAYTDIKFHFVKHNKKMWKIMVRMIRYCEKNNYWQEELQRRLTPKPINPEPTKDEIRLEKIEKKKQALIRYEKKLKYYTKLYGNKIRSVKRSIVMLERNINQIVQESNVVFPQQ